MICYFQGIDFLCQSEWHGQKEKLFTFKNRDANYSSQQEPDNDESGKWKILGLNEVDEKPGGNQDLHAVHREAGIQNDAGW